MDSACLCYQHNDFISLRPLFELFIYTYLYLHIYPYPFEETEKMYELSFIY